jgi:1-acyl-sn-glycerol-3-phosphate acyltransferase
MTLIRSLIFDIVFWLVMLVMGIALAPAAAWSREGAAFGVTRFCRIARVLLRLICGLRTEVRGPVPQDAVIVCSKHQSFLDIIIHVSVLPRPRFIMKQELKWTPILGLYAMRMGSTPVNRGKKGQAVKDMVAKAERIESGGRGQLVIYPEGTRVAPGARLPYKIGAGVLYSRMGVPCIPAATNAGVFWGRRSMLRKPGLAVVEYLPAIPAGLAVEDFMPRMEAVVEDASARLMAEAGFTPAG